MLKSAIFALIIVGLGIHTYVEEKSRFILFLPSVIVVDKLMEVRCLDDEVSIPDGSFLQMFCSSYSDQK